MVSNAITVLGTKNPDLFNTSFSKFNKSVVISTCNRLEVYISHSANVQIEAIPDFYKYSGIDAIKHLFKVSTGLDSKIIGETEILGQVKSAYQKSIFENKSDNLLHKLFREALRIGKEARSTTDITLNLESYSYALLNLIKKNKRNIRDCRILIIGTGGLGSEIAKYFVKKSKLTLTNRTYLKAKRLAKKIGAGVIKLPDLVKHINDFECVICATSCANLISSDVISKLKGERIIIDLGIPENIDNKILANKTIKVYKLVDVQELLAMHAKVKNNATQQIAVLINNYTNNYVKWLNEKIIR